MTTIKVELDAFYGYGHGGGCYGSNETIEVEINDQELYALRKLGAKEISCEAVMETIESGDTTLQSLHERLEEKFYYMVEEYWLYEADNECLDESLQESYDADTMNGVYPPVSYEECIQWFKTKNIDSNERGFLYDFEEIYYDCDEENLREQYDEYCIGKYYKWVCEHDHAFIAERVGLAIESCRDYEVDYTITLSE